MEYKTGIEWTDETWNPFVGCSIKSSGCLNCYAVPLAKRIESFGHAVNYDGVTKQTKAGLIWSGKINYGNFEKPNKIKKPSIIFVNSMSDFFHENAKESMRDKAMAVMANCSRHQFQILTKRADVMADYCSRKPIPENVWLGVTVEDGFFIDRIEILKSIKLPNIKFLSVEPLLGPLGKVNFKGIDWVISGGESGPGARDMQFEWLLEVHEQTRKYGVDHFFKQYGKAKNNPLYQEAIDKGLRPTSYVKEKDPDGKGGSLIFDMHCKEMPRKFMVQRYQK